MPKVSVITPLYNGSKTLSETADSVFKQDFTDWEWIFFDDGSSDGTQEIAKQFAESHPHKVFYYEHDENSNFGTSYTRNRAVEKSNGEIISFLDQDDVWDDNRLSHQLKIFEAYPDCAMIYGPSLYWYKERKFRQPTKFKDEDLKTGIYHPPSFIEIFLGDLKGTPLPSASLIRRKNFDAVKGYEESIKGSEDIVLWLKLAEKFSIYFDDCVLVKYRKHQDSTLRRAAQSGEMNEWNLVFYKWVIDFLKKNSASEELIDENQFAYYTILKRIAGKKNYFESRKELFKRLRLFPELKKKYSKDFLLDLFFPFEIATRISAKLRFDLLKK